MFALALIPLLLVLGNEVQAGGGKIVSLRDGKCLAYSDARDLTSGAPVTMANCNGADGMAMVWNISPGDGPIFATGGEFYLKAGGSEGAHNNGGLTLEKRSEGTPQNWFLTDDGRIAVTGTGQCLDFGNQGIQTYLCQDNNINQAWKVDGVLKDS